MITSKKDKKGIIKRDLKKECLGCLSSVYFSNFSTQNAQGGCDEVTDLAKKNAYSTWPKSPWCPQAAFATYEPSHVPISRFVGKVCDLLGW